MKPESKPGIPTLPKPLLVAVLGPTGSGKTKLTIDLAKYFGSEILSCDSRQIYSELKIGAASPSQAELEAVPHHFVGCCSVSDYYNASMFELQALQLLQQKFEHHQLMFMTGGSGLYIDAVINGIDDLPTIKTEVRQYFLDIYQSEGIEGLRLRLSEDDPEYFREVDSNNPKRMLKALEVTATAGRPYSSFLTGRQRIRPFRTLMLGLDPGRDNLYHRINQRVLDMVASGLVDEVKSLLPFRHTNALNTVGYKEIFEFIDNKVTLEDAVSLIQNSTRRYARKQMTWLRRYPELIWTDPQDVCGIIKRIEEKLKYGN